MALRLLYLIFCRMLGQLALLGRSSACRARKVIAAVVFEADDIDVIQERAASSPDERPL